MRMTESKIPVEKIIEPKVVGDERGFVMETCNQKAFREASINAIFVQKSYSRSVKPILRTNSPTVGQRVGEYLSEEHNRILWVPPGGAHSFLVTSETADFLYKRIDFCGPQHDRFIHWADNELALAWPRRNEPLVSGKDRLGIAFKEAEYFE